MQTYKSSLPKLLATVLLLLTLAIPGSAQTRVGPQGGNAHEPSILPGTQLLEMQGDIASHLVAAADAFLLEQSAASIVGRAKHWNRDLSSPTNYMQSITPNRDRLQHILGLGEARVPFEAFDLLSTTDSPGLVASGQGYEVLAVRWPTFGDVHGEGLMLVPVGRDVVANVVALPHCEITPEQLCGLDEGVPAEAQYARRLAESGCRVVVPLLISRGEKVAGITNREWLHRAAYVLGLTMTGYEVQKTLAVVDFFEKSSDLPVGVMGYGDGGLIALYAAATDPRIDAACVSGAFGGLDALWEQPLDRMVFSLKTQFGDAELASMIAPRRLIVETAPAPEEERSSGKGAPYRIATPKARDIRREVTRARSLVAGLTDQEWLTRTDAGNVGSEAALAGFLAALSPGGRLASSGPPPTKLRASIENDARQTAQMHELDRHAQGRMHESHWVRESTFWSKLDFSSVEAYEASIVPLRTYFHDEIIGRLDLPLALPNARTRLDAESETWTRYEVVLDVFDGVFAYGLLIVPKGIEEGERRPVVVCQHGLEGRPQHLVGEEGYRAYKAFATALAERGFVTFAPQNLYLFGDRFRTLQRKANPLGMTLFSIIVPQHQQIVDWLQEQPFVNPDRIAFYGLSYGGKTAMRVPPLVSDYSLAVCSGDFNEWVDKNASTRNPRSYMDLGEYEIFEWNLGHTFNYAEMAALIAPRPFMVERGHLDGVADDWTVAWEYARVRLLYASRLKIPEHTEIEWFNGPHTINGEGSYAFLHRHLNWPEPGE